MAVVAAADGLDPPQGQERALEAARVLVLCSRSRLREWSRAAGGRWEGRDVRDRRLARQVDGRERRVGVVTVRRGVVDRVLGRDDVSLGEYRRAGDVGRDGRREVDV